MTMTKTETTIRPRRSSGTQASHDVTGSDQPRHSIRKSHTVDDDSFSHDTAQHRPISNTLRRSKTIATIRSPPMSRSGSESALEHEDDGEDEGFRSTRALPAPRFRPRKGLRGSVEFETSWQASRISPTRQASEDVGIDGLRVSSDDLQARSYVKSIMALLSCDASNPEITRRAAEVISFFCIGWTVFQQHSQTSLPWLLIFKYQSAIVSLLLVISMSRVALQPLFSEGRFSIGGLRFPASLDPATLLYPVYLPMLVAFSTSGSNGSRLVANAVIGLSSIPEWLSSPLLTQSSSGSDMVVWVLTLSPMLNDSIRAAVTTHGLSGEVVSCLYPLHQCLLRPLYYLSTTSLLPAELHLLSASLINLLLFSRSPAMIVLKLLLWIGGVGLFALCMRTFRRIVALERIPRTSFSAIDSIAVPERNFWLSILSGFGLPDQLAAGNFLPSDTRSEVSMEDTNDLQDKDDIDDVTEAPASIVGGDGQRRMSISADARPRDKTRRKQLLSRLSTFELKAQSFLFNAYSYAAVLALILIPIRMKIGSDALDHHEPFLWAIGYLFGNIEVVRYYVGNLGLEKSVVLPDSSTASITECMKRTEWMACLRDDAFGPANFRLVLFLYWAVVIACGISIVLTLSAKAEVDTRRKVFHGMMVVMLLPTAYVDPMFLALGLVLVLAVFLLLDLFRAAQIKPLARPLARFLAPYVDGRDHKGPVIVSHIFLLIGCAIPFWLSLAGIELTYSGPWKSWEAGPRDVSMVAGVVCVGMGDAAASLIGRRYGRHKWFWAGGKSLEGSVAFALAVTAGLTAGKLWLVHGGWQAKGIASLPDFVSKALVAGCGASFTEAVLTGCNDNVVVPIILWLLVRGLHL